MRRIETLIEKLKDLHVQIGGKLEPLSNCADTVVDSKGEAFKGSMFSLRELIKEVKELNEKRKATIRARGFCSAERLSKGESKVELDEEIEPLVKEAESSLARLDKELRELRRNPVSPT